MKDKGEMGMRGFPMPSEHKEVKMNNLGTSNLKYVEGEFSNPKKLKESNDALCSYVKKNQMKY